MHDFSERSAITFTSRDLAKLDDIIIQVTHAQNRLEALRQALDSFKIRLHQLAFDLE